MKSRLNDLKKLLETFEANLAQYKSSIYDEAKTRVDYIDKFFELLDWDVRNTKGYSEDYREVVREDRVVIQGKPKAPDYSFRIGKERKFFVEAKKPIVDIKQDRDPAFQLRRYAYTAKLPLSILTDFEEFAVYDTRIKPDHKDEASKARIFYTTYKEYPHYFDFIYSTFSREAILKGSFDRYVTESKGKRGTSEVDKEFLKLIETWRNDLARNIALRNKDLTLYSLNHAVQKIIDRIIFLRIAEDRQMEVYGLLAEAAKGRCVYEVIDTLFQRADQKYNGGLFQKQDWISKLAIDDKIMKSIVQGLYYPQCPYELSVMPIEILGNIYEQFLGKTIRLTAGHQAKVEEKPEVRKAGGVYYTPQYIVDYIVKNTVDEKVKGRTPKQISELRILDPACGSGSFLVGAYTFLLHTHLEYYTKPNNLVKNLKQGTIYQVAEKTYRLSTKEKQRILLNNIYGVDIDSQAVEVTKLSLLLKLMEDENIEAEGDLFKHSDFKLLPDLSNNIKCGNSLVGPDIYDNLQTLMFDESETFRINAFDWGNESSGFSTHDRFDVVIGNPPYIRIQAMKEWAPNEVEYYKQNYSSASKGNYDIYVVFVEKGLSLLNRNGLLGFILPHKFFNSKYGEPLRKLISNGKHLNAIIHFGHQQIFSNATTYTCLLFLKKKGSDQFHFAKVHDLSDWLKDKKADEGIVPATNAKHDEWNFIIGKDSKLFYKLNHFSTKLGDIAKIFQGLVTGADSVFVLEKIEMKNSSTIILRDEYGNLWELEADILKPFLKNTTLSSFDQPEFKHYIIFPYKIHNGKASLLTKEQIRISYPRTWEYFCNKSKILRNREKGKMDNERWYSYSRTQNLTLMDETKLIVQVISRIGKYAFDDSGIYFTGGGNGPYYGIRLNDNQNPHSLHYLQALLNSLLLDFYLHRISSPLRGGYWSYGKRFIEKIPIRTIDFNNPQEVDVHNLILSMVKKIMELNQKLKISEEKHNLEVFQRKIDYVNKQIDQLIYNLYNLTKKEIQILEEGVK